MEAAVEGDMLHFLKPCLLASQKLSCVSVHVSNTFALFEGCAGTGVVSPHPTVISPMLQIRIKAFQYSSTVTQVLGDRVKI